ncbi:GTPase [Thiolapillus sp.]
MKPSSLRLALALAAALGLMLLLAGAIVLTDTLVNIWHNLRDAPLALQLLVAVVLGAFGLLSGWVIWRLLRPAPRTRNLPDDTTPPSREELERRLQEAREAGLDTSAAEAELERLQKRRAAGRIEVAFFGEISAGKSSLVRALLPDAEVETHVLGGTTREVREYHWTSPAGDQLVLLDMPGLDEADGDLDELARQEALRAHIVVYVVDGDLTRSQAAELERLLELGKPTLVALNKIDRLDPQSLELVRARLQERVDALGKAEVVPVSTGATVTAVVRRPDGTEEEVERQRPPQVEALQQALQRIIDSHAETLAQLRDSAVFVLVRSHLDEALARHRREEAERIVSGYSKKAVAGAVAAMTPGTDLIIQGFLATRMIKELAALYDVPVRKVDIELLLELIQKHVKTHVTLLLAVAGNAFKAFPGTGTLAGGALHAVAYGMLFDALGKSLSESLATRGALHPLQVADQFEEELGEEIKRSAAHYARLAFEQLAGRKRD